MTKRQQNIKVNETPSHRVTEMMRYPNEEELKSQCQSSEFRAQSSELNNSPQLS